MIATTERQPAPMKHNASGRTAMKRDTRSRPALWLTMLVFVLCACGSKSPTELEAERRAAVRAALARHLDHEERMLSILETNRNAPDAAARELGLYTTRYSDDLEALCSQRRLLETEPDALANALAELSDRSHAAFSRRRALYDSNPTLMDHPEVKRALSRLDTL